MNELGAHAVPLPVPNLPLLRKVLDQITAHPETWFQEAWAVNDKFWEHHRAEHVLEPRCGTAQCVAGWAVLAAGYEMNFLRGDSEASTCYSPADGVAGRRSIRSTAEKELGLTYPEAEALFAATNSFDRIRKVAEKIAARAGEVL